MANDSQMLSKSKKAKDDEFYTLYEDIASELPHYKDQLKGKRIICPCDWDQSLDEVLVYASEEVVEGSDLLDGGTIKIIDNAHINSHVVADISEVKCNFIKFLVAHADDYGIASIAVSGYDPATGKGVKFQDIDYSKYDVVITNPPFTQFREFIETMFANDMSFLVIAPQNAITYKDCFNHMMNNEMWIGYHYHLNGFTKPDGTVIGKQDNLARSCCWFTNLDVSYRHDEMILVEKYDPIKNPKYFNFDAIEVSKSSAIPYDYDGLMGVPITFLQKYNPDQFEIIGYSSEFAEPKREIKEFDPKRTGGDAFYIKTDDGKFQRKFGRIVIRNKHPYIEE